VQTGLKEGGRNLAVGPQRAQHVPVVLQMVVGQGLRLAVAGVAIEAVVALLLTRVFSGFSHLLYGVRADDPTMLAAVSAMLIGTAGLACYIPARRAANPEPTAAFRQE
jgi:ABC-type lipoprotein release transport system permease subunit